MRTAGHVEHGVSGVLAAGAGSVLVAGCVEVAVEKLKEGFAVKRSEEGGKYSSVEFPPLNPFGGFTVELEFGRPRGLCWWGLEWRERRWAAMCLTRTSLKGVTPEPVSLRLLG